MAAIAEGDCDRALAGGADTALHPVTWSELRRDGLVSQGLVLGEGAALLALERAGASANPLGFVERASVYPGRRRSLDDLLAAAAQAEPTQHADCVVLAPWGEPARTSLQRFAAEVFAGAPLLDVTRGLGEALAATPALAWVAALDRVASGEAARAVVVSAGIDGDVGVVTLARELPR